MDPLADKILTCSAFICLIVTRPESMPAWIVIIIIAREFVISGFRLVGQRQRCCGSLPATGESSRQTSRLFAIILLIADFGGPVAFVIEQILVYIALILTIVSLVGLSCQKY